MKCVHSALHRPRAWNHRAHGISRGERAALSNGASRVQRRLHPVAAVVSHAECRCRSIYIYIYILAVLFSKESLQALKT